MSAARLRFALVLSTLGLFVSGVLSLGHLSGIPVPCGGSSGCETVAQHPLATPFGIPVAYVGFIGYLAIFLASFRMSSGSGRMASFRVLTGLGFVASLGLVLASRFVIQATCTWCLASAAIMSLLAWIGCFAKPSEDRLGEGKFWLVAPAMACLGAWFVANGTGGPPPHNPEALNTMSLSELAPQNRPSLGTPGGSVIIVEFADFSCVACRAMHVRLRHDVERSQRIRWVFRHLPLNRIAGHETAGRAAVLSEMCHEKGKFWEFADGVFGKGRALTAVELDRLAGSLCGESHMAGRLENGSDSAYTAVNADLRAAKQLGLTQTPTYLVIEPSGKRICLDARGLVQKLGSLK